MTSDDLHRTNINLLSSDVAYLRDLLGFGWTEKVREIVHEYVLHVKAHNSLEAASIDYSNHPIQSGRTDRT